MLNQKNYSLFNNNYNISFYTDGSLINTSLIQTFMTAGFIVISDSNIITHSFTTTLKYWPSSLCAKIHAILFTLIVSPLGCNIDIFTQKLSLLPFISPHNFFKFSNNNLIWNNIHHLIHSKQLNIHFKKVKAHTNNSFNNHIDLLYQHAYFDLAPMLIIRQHFFTDINHLPSWNSMLLKQRLRGFIKYSKLSLLPFLTSNKKYTSTVDWKLILSFFHNNTEQLPVLEKTKFQFTPYTKMLIVFYVKNYWKPFTTFGLVHIMMRIYHNFKNHIISAILTHNSDLQLLDVSLEFDLLKLYLNIQNVTKFNFIDIIKGFVPISLCSFIEQYHSHSQIVDILEKNYDALYDNSLGIHLECLLFNFYYS
ncbi:hypothetical protein RclHR1_05930016 [Rhizophagus clarus]|uniref:Ribonuclease H-like domain-containing protein n=1 Tax=Rhizophagus clarus TaxID=94130 RepID=A0A2Z6RPU8_9GLOM|nr:hypothetical protein RclHR1_05930016 [Rhizophagus clarus]GES93844.1 ribonuclease H-like domain-containing protein [Rhizophagus clarus]